MFHLEAGKGVTPEAKIPKLQFSSRIRGSTRPVAQYRRVWVNSSNNIPSFVKEMWDIAGSYNRSSWKMIYRTYAYFWQSMTLCRRSSVIPWHVLRFSNFAQVRTKVAVFNKLLGSRGSCWNMSPFSCEILICSSVVSFWDKPTKFLLALQQPPRTPSSSS